MDTLLSLKTFRQVVECGSFTKAADRLGLSPAMVSKHVQHLEAHVGAKLLLRNTRSLHLTEAGSAYYEQCAYALDTLQQAAAKAAGGVARAQGLLRLTMPVWLAAPQFAQWLTEYTHLYPDVTLDVTLDNRHNDLVGEGFDLALRVSDTPAPTLVARRLGMVRFWLCASAGFVARHGLPQDVAAVQRCPAVLPTYVDMRSRALLGPGGQREMLHLHQPIAGSNNSLMAYQLVLAGMGIGYLPDFLARDDVASGRLHRLLPGYDMPEHPLYAGYTDRQFLSAKVRSFIDFISAKFAAVQR